MVEEDDVDDYSTSENKSNNDPMSNLFAFSKHQNFVRKSQYKYYEDT